MLRSACGLLGVLLAGFLASAAADDKADEKKADGKLTGTWVREAEGFEIKFSFPKDGQFKLALDAGGNGLVIDGKVKVDKDGLVTATVEKTEKKGDFPVVPKAGTEFKFKLKIDGKKAKLTDFTSDMEGHEGAKNIMEGEYAAKDEK